MRFFWRLFLILFFISIKYTYAQKKETHKGKTHPKELTAKKEKNIKYGIASFYASKFQGRSTHNDEIYDSAKYTAACNVISLNTWLRVTNLKNKKSIIVRVNDRMNPKNKRLIDLSKIAARELGFISSGIVKVKVEILKGYKNGDTN